jgi:hypothetical protein
MQQLKTQSFPYNPLVVWLGAIFFGGTILFILFLGTSVPEFEDGLYLLPFVIISVAFLAYFYYKYLAPILSGKIALQLDEEKLTFPITKRTIYWKNVADIRLENYKNLNTMYFTMLDGGKDIVISLNWIKGDNADLYNAIVAFYNDVHP